MPVSYPIAAIRQLRSMSHTRIKICGITRPEDARRACLAGADAIGMVFHAPARRYVTPERARSILAALTPYAMPVALFVDADARTIRQITGTLGITEVQLNGTETPALVRELAPLRVIKAIGADAATLPETLDLWRSAIVDGRLSNLCGLVIDTPHTGLPGGSGVANDWATVMAAQREGAFAGLPPLVAAGGLTPQTVGEVVRTVRPYAVDVSSGVESATGIKDATKIEAFIAAARAADD